MGSKINGETITYIVKGVAKQLKNVEAKVSSPLNSWAQLEFFPFGCFWCHWRSYGKFTFHCH
jgi:hypothetical protein